MTTTTKPSTTSSSSARKAPAARQHQRSRPPRCQLCLRRKDAKLDESSSAASGSRRVAAGGELATPAAPPSSPYPAETPDAVPAATEDLAACDECERARARDRIGRALGGWDAYPQTTTSSSLVPSSPPPPFSSSVVIRTRPCEDERRKRRRLSAVPIGELPIAMPVRRVAKKYLFLRPRVVAASDGGGDARKKEEGGVGSAKKKLITATVPPSSRELGTKVGGNANVNPNVKKTVAADGGGSKTKPHDAAPGRVEDLTNSTKEGGAAASSNPNAKQQPANADNTKKRKRVDRLLGAIVRIRKGKFAGFQGKIIERQNIRRIMLDSVPQRAFDVDDMSIVQPGKNAPPPYPTEKPQTLRERREEEEGLTNEELAARYEGAVVRVSEGRGGGGPASGRYHGTMGRVVRVIAGNWYITDNPAIANAFQAHKFEVVREADPDEAERFSSGAGGRTTKAGSRRIGTKIVVDGRRGVGGDVAPPTGAQGPAPGIAGTPLRGVPAGKSGVGGAGESAGGVHEKAPQDRGSNTKACASAGAKVGTKPGPKAGASAGAKAGTKPTNPPVRRFELMGATIRINKGRYMGRICVIKEKQSIRRLQLDTALAPLDFSDVEVLEYTPAGARIAAVSGRDRPPPEVPGGGGALFAEFARRLQTKYMGARVRVLRPKEHGGVREGRVVRVVVLGDWYIVDDPVVTTAFPMHKFDVVKYAGPVEVVDLASDSDEEEKQKGGMKNDGRSNVVVLDVDEEDVNDDGGTAVEAKRVRQLPSSIRPDEPVVEAKRAHQPPFANRPKKLAGKDGVAGQGGPIGEGPNDAPIADDSLHPKLPYADRAKILGEGGGAGGDDGGKEHSKEGNVTENALIHNIVHPEPPTLDDQNKHADEEGPLSKEDTNREDSKGEDVPTGDALPPELAFPDDQNNFANGDDVVVNEDLIEDSKQDATVTHDVVTEICSVQLPTTENIELAARLSAFDSFLFLADGGGLGMREFGSTRSTKGGDHVDTSTMVEGTVKSAAKSTSTLAAAKSSGSKEQTPAPKLDRSGTGLGSSPVASADEAALSRVILQLIQQKQKSQQWPISKVIPGTEVFAEQKRGQPPLRVVPLEERIVSMVPGGDEEREDLVRRLGVFDDFLFLVDER